MKNTILVLVITLFMIGAFMTSCQWSSEKSDNVQEKVKDTKEKVVDSIKVRNQAIRDSIQVFKRESEEIISSNEKKLTELKGKLANEKKEDRAVLEKKLTELEQKNSDIKEKLENYKDEGQDKWEMFKAEVNHDMNELGKAFKDLTVKNVNEGK